MPESEPALAPGRRRASSASTVGLPSTGATDTPPKTRLRIRSASAMARRLSMPTSKMLDACVMGAGLVRTISVMASGTAASSAVSCRGHQVPPPPPPEATPASWSRATSGVLANSAVSRRASALPDSGASGTKLTVGHQVGKQRPAAGGLQALRKLRAVAGEELGRRAAGISRSVTLCRPSHKARELRPGQFRALQDQGGDVQLQLNPSPSPDPTLGPARLPGCPPTLGAGRGSRYVLPACGQHAVGGGRGGRRHTDCRRQGPPAREIGKGYGIGVGKVGQLLGPEGVRRAGSPSWAAMVRRMV